MTQFFYRHGQEVTGDVQFHNRSHYVVQAYPCGRCGGQGEAEHWKRTGFTCYECHGTGFRSRTREVTVYTAEALAKLEAKAVAKAKAAFDAEKAKTAAFEAQHAELLAKVNQLKDTSGFINDVITKGYKYGTLSAAQVSAVTKAVDAALVRQAALQASQHIGVVDERTTLELTVIFVTSYEGVYGTTYVHGFKDDAGNVVIHKGNRIRTEVEVDTRDRYIEKGDKIRISVTIKEHGVRDGVQQTIVSRPSKGELI